MRRTIAIRYVRMTSTLAVSFARNIAVQPMVAANSRNRHPGNGPDRLLWWDSCRSKRTRWTMASYQRQTFAPVFRTV